MKRIYSIEAIDNSGAQLTLKENLSYKESLSLYKLYCKTAGLALYEYYCQFVIMRKGNNIVKEFNVSDLN